MGPQIFRKCMLCFQILGVRRVTWSKLLIKDCVENVACLKSGNILHTVHISCYPTLQHLNSYNRTDNYRQWNAVGSPDDGHKDARNTFRYYWLPINHYLLHLVGFSFTYLSKIHGHSNIKIIFCYFSPHNSRCIWYLSKIMEQIITMEMSKYNQ